MAPLIEFYPVTAYLAWPLVWCVGAPAPLTTAGMREIVARGELDSGVTVKVSREGLFQFDFSALDSERALGDLTAANKAEYQAAFAHRVALLNAHIACLHTAHSAIDGRGRQYATLARTDVLHHAVSEAWYSQGITVAGARSAVTNHEQRTAEDLASPGAREREIGSLPALELSFRLLSDLEESAANHIEHAGLLLRSAQSYEEDELGLSLIASWAVTETLVFRMWAAHLRDRGLNAKRRKDLQGRDWTASVVIESPQLANKIGSDLYKNLTAVRRARNAWAHELTPVTHEAGKLALDVAVLMLSRASGTAALGLRARGPSSIP
jgi:hypothetical protein